MGSNDSPRVNCTDVIKSSKSPQVCSEQQSDEEPLSHENLLQEKPLVIHVKSSEERKICRIFSKQLQVASRCRSSVSSSAASDQRRVVVKGIINLYLRDVNSIFAIKLRSLFAVLKVILLSASLVQAGFWTFYFPNFLKPSGYKELTKMINQELADLNSTMDNFADIQHFWGLMQKFDTLEFDYPEDSVCAEVFPLFRDMAIEYAYIDYEHFIEPIKQFHDHLVAFRSEYYPEGEKGKTILPRQWEHDLYRKELDLKIEWHNKLINSPEYKFKREKMVNIWQSVRRGLDSSIPCIYLRYAFRQTAEDINQLALELNLESMYKSVELLDVAFKRTKLLENSDENAIKKIQEVLKEEERFRIK